MYAAETTQKLEGLKNKEFQGHRVILAPIIKEASTESSYIQRHILTREVMDDLQSDILAIQPEAAEASKRRKPGPKTRDDSRTEKLSCRLSKDEKAKSEAYCREHGTNEAKLLRASYLATITRTSDKRIDEIATAIEKLPILSRAAIREILKKCALFGLIFLFGYFCSNAELVAKYFLQSYRYGAIIMGPHDTCIYHNSDDDGCEMVRDR